MTPEQLCQVVQLAATDADRANIIESRTDDEREALQALIDYESMCDRAPLDALLARLDACADDVQRAALLVATAPPLLQQLKLELALAPMKTNTVASWYAHMIDVEASTLAK